MNRANTAKTLFKEGFNCAQSLFAACGVDQGIDHKTALKVASAFGGGIGETGETCGAVTGALMVIGLKYGATDAKDKETRTKTYKLAKKFMKKFKSRNNKHSVLCRELLGVDIGSSAQIKIDEKKCLKYIRESAEIIEEII